MGVLGNLIWWSVNWKADSINIGVYSLTRNMHKDIYLFSWSCNDECNGFEFPVHVGENKVVQNSSQKIIDSSRNPIELQICDPATKTHLKWQYTCFKSINKNHRNPYFEGHSPYNNESNFNCNSTQLATDFPRTILKNQDATICWCEQIIHHWCNFDF